MLYNLNLEVHTTHDGDVTCTASYRRNRVRKLKLRGLFWKGIGT